MKRNTARLIAPIKEFITSLQMHFLPLKPKQRQPTEVKDRPAVVAAMYGVIIIRTWLMASKLLKSNQEANPGCVTKIKPRVNITIAINTT